MPRNPSDRAGGLRRIPRRVLRKFLRGALQEDRSNFDRTTRALFPRPIPGRGVITAQAAGIVSGCEASAELGRLLRLRARIVTPDGSRCRPGSHILELRGDARSILTGERTMLNLLMHLSGVATMTAATVRNAGKLRVYATRKTLPGLRDLEKWAVIWGGGYAHRRDLSDGILVKNNHLALIPLPEAVRQAKRSAPRGIPVEVEVRSIRDAVIAADAGADALLLDNVGPARARRMVRALAARNLRRGLFLEVSGGITPQNIRRYRSVGVDAASLGTITHSARALPFHLTLTPE